MMKTVAVICEYNPFHRGHEYQLMEIRRRFGDCRVVGVMSGAMTINEAVSAMAKTDESKTAETWETAQKRVMEGLREIADEAARKGQNQVLVVSHGMAISAAVAAIDPEAEAGELGNASITKLICDGGTFTVESVNDMSYIEE